MDLITDPGRLGVVEGGTGDARVGARAAALAGWFDVNARHAVAAPTRHTGARGTVCYEAPGLQVFVDPARVEVEVGASSLTLCCGRPRLGDGFSSTPARDVAQAIEREGATGWKRLRGRFALIHVDLRARTVSLVADRFGVYPLCYAQDPQRSAFSDRADAVPASAPLQVDPQAIFNYVYFHMIPAPRTIFRDVWRVEAAEAVNLDAQGRHAAPWWLPHFEVDHATPVEGMKKQFLDLVQQAVAREATQEKIGSFLSGGTDSSTVAGMLVKVKGRPTPTFSIGFDASGYDEISYARIAAQHFGNEQHEYYVTPDDLVRSIPSVAASYDQPFGNSSALPAFYCALRAREAGIEKLLAGDGGDELFGGNTRYAKQKVFAVYDLLPRALRAALLEPVLTGQAWPRHVPLLKKVASYVAQARIPMPDRMETYNLLDRFGGNAVFGERFFPLIREGEPRALQREIYARPQSGSLVDKMLAYDWRFTLADNDLPKVVGTSQLAGQQVGFPFLDDDLLDFSLRLAPGLKVRGLSLRYFFKQALTGFLPQAIIRKSKHGFGLPFGAWLVRNERLRALAHDALDRITERGIVRPGLAQELFSVRLQEHAGYFGEMIWILMMLEHWLQAKAPEYRA